MPKQYICSECGNSYGYYKNLRKHVSKAHPNKLGDIAPSKKSKKSFSYKCKICPRQYNHKHNLKHHERKCHGMGYANTDTLKCVLCSFTTNQKTCLYEHLEVEHYMSLKLENKTFSSLEDFIQWKNNVEKETLSRFVKKCGSRLDVENITRHYYICHRSGHYSSRGVGVRRLKSQGSNKINGICPASIQVFESQDGACKVNYISTHVGHENDLAHLSLTESERSSLATDIANNIPFDAILDKARTSMPHSKSERIHLLTRKDLHNIENYYKTQSSERNINDTTSVNAFVSETNSIENPQDRDKLIIHVDENYSSEEDNITEALLKNQKNTLKKELLHLLDGITTANEINVIKQHLKLLKVALAAVCSKKGSNPMTL